MMRGLEGDLIAAVHHRDRLALRDFPDDEGIEGSEP
jgi:hypothetical protein